MTREEAKIILKEDSKYGISDEYLSGFSDGYNYVNDVLLSQEKLHMRLNEILHKNKEAPKKPSLCDLVAYVETDLKEKDNEISRLRKKLAKDHHVDCGCSYCQVPRFKYGEPNEK